MKQLIVMIAMIILGIAIGALIIGFSDTASTIKDRTNERIINSIDGWMKSDAGNWTDLAMQPGAAS